MTGNQHHGLRSKPQRWKIQQGTLGKSLVVLNKKHYNILGMLVCVSIGYLIGKIESKSLTRRESLVTPNDNRPSISVEDVMYKFKSDKSRDDHGYSKLYEMLFSQIRHSTSNITEVGIAAGQSLQAWFRYFPNADIHAFDIQWMGNDGGERVKANMENLKPRVHPHIVNILDEKITLDSLGFRNESMDIIIEDGPHTSRSQQEFLVKLFPILKPKGLYIIEDIGYAQNGIEVFHDNPSKLSRAAREIIESNDAIWIDSSLGHRAWDEWLRRSGSMWARNHTHHNSFCVVIQKRERPLLQPVQMNYGNGAMNADKILTENGQFSLRR